MADEEVKVYIMNGSECKNSPFQQMNLRKIIREVLTQERATSSQKANQGTRGHAPPILRMPGPPPESKNGWSGPSFAQVTKWGKVAYRR